MAQEEVERIKRIFEGYNLHPEYLEHEEVVTSIDAAATRGFELRQGIKAIVLTNGLSEFIVVCVAADRKVDLKKVCENVSWSKNKTRMATEEEVEEITGCKIGAVPPFGHKTKLKIFVDEGVFENEFSAFNIGLRSRSVKIKTGEMKTLFENIGAEVGEFVKT